MTVKQLMMLHTTTGDTKTHQCWHDITHIPAVHNHGGLLVLVHMAHSLYKAHQGGGVLWNTVVRPSSILEVMDYQCRLLGILL